MTPASILARDRQASLILCRRQVPAAHGLHGRASGPWSCSSGRGQNRGCDMAKPEAVFIYIGTYPGEAAARADYDVVKDLHAAGAVGSYDAAVVTKDGSGKVHVNKDE